MTTDEKKNLYQFTVRTSPDLLPTLLGAISPEVELLEFKVLKEAEPKPKQKAKVNRLSRPMVEHILLHLRERTSNGALLSGLHAFISTLGYDEVSLSPCISRLKKQNLINYDSAINLANRVIFLTKEGIAAADKLKKQEE